MDHAWWQRNVFLACEPYSSGEPNKSTCPQSLHKNLDEYKIVTADPEHAAVVHVSVWLLATRGSASMRKCQQLRTGYSRVFKREGGKNSLVICWKDGSLGSVWQTRKAVSILDHTTKTSDDVCTNVNLGHDGETWGHRGAFTPALPTQPTGWLDQPNGG